MKRKVLDVGDGQSVMDSYGLRLRSCVVDGEPVWVAEAAPLPQRLAPHLENAVSLFLLASEGCCYPNYEDALLVFLDCIGESSDCCQLAGDGGSDVDPWGVARAIISPDAMMVSDDGSRDLGDWADAKFIVLPPSQGVDANWHVTDDGDLCAAHCYGFGGSVDGGEPLAKRIKAALNFCRGVPTNLLEATRLK